MAVAVWFAALVFARRSFLGGFGMKPSMRSFAVYLLVAWLCGCGSSRADEPAELIVDGGDIVTLDDAQPMAEAVAVTAGRIVEVGRRQDVIKRLGPRTKHLDLRGHALVPGFIDAHGHRDDDRAADGRRKRSVAASRVGAQHRRTASRAVRFCSRPSIATRTMDSGRGL